MAKRQDRTSIERMLRLERFFGAWKSKALRNLRMFEWSRSV